MDPRKSSVIAALLLLFCLSPLCSTLRLVAQEEQLFFATLNVVPPSIRDDSSVRYDYDIVYVRARRAGDEIAERFYADFSHPITMEPGADLMLLHPDGSEELLVEGGRGSITDCGFV